MVSTIPARACRHRRSRVNPLRKIVAVRAGYRLVAIDGTIEGFNVDGTLDGFFVGASVNF